MPDVLIREVPTGDLEDIRSAADAQGTSVQKYLRETVHAQAVYLRRQAALTTIAEGLEGASAMSDDDRQAVFDAIDDAHAERAEQLADRSNQ